MSKSAFQKILVALCLALCLSLVVCACTPANPEDPNPTDTEPAGVEDTSSIDEVEESTEDETESTPADTKVTYTVTVVDADNLPLSGATVQLCVGDQCLLPVVTDENGVATMELDKADYTVKVTLDGYVGEESYSFDADSTELTVTLTADLTEAGAGESEDNPIYPEFDDNFTATVTVPAGKTYYFASYGISSDMTLTANGEVVEVTYGSMMLRTPSTFTLTNNGTEDVEYTLVGTFPAGSQMNPAVIDELGEITANLAAGTEGYNYQWTATADGMLVINIWDGSWLVSLYNQTSYAMTDTLYSDSGAYQTALAVKSGDVVVITVNTYNPDEPWNAPEGTITFETSFSSATEEEPCDISSAVIWSEDGSEATASVTVNAGATFYFQTYGSGMILWVNGEEYCALTSANPRMPAVFSITNEEEYAMNYSLTFTYPAGTMENPAELVMGENTAAIAEGNSQGYCFTYVAEAAGTLTLTFSEANGGGWMYVVNNMTTYSYGDMQWSDSDPVLDTATVAVSAGDELQIMVNTYDPANMWSNPAGTIVVTASFA